MFCIVLYRTRTRLKDSGFMIAVSSAVVFASGLLRDQRKITSSGFFKNFSLTTPTKSIYPNKSQAHPTYFKQKSRYFLIFIIPKASHSNN